MSQGSEITRIDRRKFLRTTAGVFGAAASSLLECRNEAASATLEANSSASDLDPDQLFRAGWFAEADWGYRRILDRDPDNVHALSRRGNIALLSNRFALSEYLLSQAIRLAPDDNSLKRWLAGCFVSQN